MWMSNQPGSAMWTCPNCGVMASVLDGNCPNCRIARGASTAPLGAPGIAPSSGTNPIGPLVAAASIVTVGIAGRIGRYMDEAPRHKTPRSRGVAIALAFVLGFCGAQYFYMGRRILAVLSVVFCWTGYPAVVGMVEGLRMLFMSEREFQRACV
jgi:TM2 domain-containing membrane protein YozV